MPPPDEPRRNVDALTADSERVRLTSEDLRALSKRLLAEIQTLRELELESRKMRVGSREFALVSAEIEARAKMIFRMASEQRTMAEVVPPENESLAEMDETSDDAASG
jgi:hypothetical protein